MNTVPPDHQHPQCYASVLKGCSHKGSLEHFVSAGVLKVITGGKYAYISGLTSLSGIGESRENIEKSKKIQKRILCERHNNTLSTIDENAKRFFSYLKKILHVDAIPDCDPVGPYRVLGSDIERWMLKTLTGGLYSGEFPMPDGMTAGDGFPPQGWMEFIYNNSPMPEYTGLRVFQGQFPLIPGSLQLQVTPEIPVNEGLTRQICGIQFQVFGIAMYYSSVPTPVFPQWCSRPPRICGPAGDILIDWEGNRVGDEIVFRTIDTVNTISKWLHWSSTTY